MLAALRPLGPGVVTSCMPGRHFCCAITRMLLHTSKRLPASPQRCWGGGGVLGASRGVSWWRVHMSLYTRHPLHVRQSLKPYCRAAFLSEMKHQSTGTGFDQATRLIQPETTGWLETGRVIGPWCTLTARSCSKQLKCCLTACCCYHEHFLLLPLL